VGVILTFAEQRDGKLRRASLETVSEARRLAGPLTASVTTVVIGPGSEALAAELTAQGADRVVVFDDPAFGSYATESYARALAQATSEAKPSVVLVPFTAMGKDLAPRVAAKIGAGLVSDCVALEVKDGRLIARRPMCARTSSRWDRRTRPARSTWSAVRPTPRHVPRSRA
jgi:electron transfer flavoprotein alpha subunit